MPAEICLHPLDVPEKEERQINIGNLVQPNIGTQHNAQERDV
jgi:hypothetical protein